MSAAFPDWRHLGIGKGSNWAYSIWLGTIVNLYWAPDALFYALRDPLWSLTTGLGLLLFHPAEGLKRLLTGIFLTVTRLASWIIGRALLFFFGIAGFCVVHDRPASEIYGDE